MNAAIRAVVRTALHHNQTVFGIHHGYTGMIEGDIVSLHAHSVSNIIQRGGTVLKTSRSEEFLTVEGRARAAEQLRNKGITALMAIGGDGTFRGAVEFTREHNIPVIGVPATIDNDLFGTDETIGFDTALNTAVDAIDKIRDTAESLERAFYIEVMGRTSGYIALNVGLSCGAEFIAIPEIRETIDTFGELISNQRTTKRSYIVIVAEGEEEGGAFALAKRIRERYGIEYRVCVLGHIQRGGNPTVRDRVLASRLGSAAVETFLAGKRNVMVGYECGAIAYTALSETSKRKPIDGDLLALAHILAS